jgi:hypothetical protein
MLTSHTVVASGKTYQELQAENKRLEREAEKVLREIDFGRSRPPSIFGWLIKKSSSGENR